jgi:hypothetical protein
VCGIQFIYGVFHICCEIFRVYVFVRFHFTRLYNNALYKLSSFNHLSMPSRNVAFLLTIYLRIRILARFCIVNDEVFESIKKHMEYSYGIGGTIQVNSRSIINSTLLKLSGHYTQSVNAKKQQWYNPLSLYRFNGR